MSKLSKKTKDAIISEVNKMADAYAVFEAMSVKMDKKMQKYTKKAMDNNDSELMNQLIDITVPMTPTGQMRHGEYHGRLYLYMAISEIDAKIRKVKRKK